MTAALLLSGGMDSVALAWWKRPDLAITIDYGQLAAKAEISAAMAVCKRLSIAHYIVHVDCRALGSGDMAGSDPHTLAPESDWWPFRNQLLVTLAGIRAISEGANQLLLGTVKSDGFHKDGTKAFISAIDALTACQEGGLRVSAPAIDLTTSQLLLTSGIPVEIISWAHSCHVSNVPCGACRGCNKYFKVFEEIGYDLDRSG
jgi:7-cyano-7-deazaguanine synthase